MKGRTYRFFAGEPLYPFGYGLSYARFAYSNLRLSRQGSGWDQVDVSVDVTNAGTRSGHEVVQLYVRPIAPKVPMPTRDLRGFERLLLQPGERRTVSFRLLTSEMMVFYDEAQKGFTVAPGQYEVGVGASSRDIRATTGLIVGSDASWRPLRARP